MSIEETLVGEILTHIDLKDSDEIILTTQSGRKILIYHSQDCCETVSIVGTDGEWNTLLGKPLVEVTHDAESGDEQYGTFTDTKLTFRVDGATVINRWHGESNGYYSESVDLKEITEQGAR